MVPSNYFVPFLFLTLTLLNWLFSGHALCLHVRQKEMLAWGLLILAMYHQSLPLMVVWNPGMCVPLVLSYVLKWIEMKIMPYLEGECFHVESFWNMPQELFLFCSMLAYYSVYKLICIVNFNSGRALKLMSGILRSAWRFGLQNLWAILSSCITSSWRRIINVYIILRPFLVAQDSFYFNPIYAAP